MKKWKLQRLPLHLVFAAVGLMGLCLLIGASKTWWTPGVGVLLVLYGPQLYLLWRQRR